MPAFNIQRMKSSGWVWALLLAVLGVAFSVIFAAEPLYAMVPLVGLGGLYCLFKNFELTVVCILLMRSSLDLYSTQQVPAAFGIAVDLLVFLYVGRQLIVRRAVKTDPFWWFLLVWVSLQSIWVGLLAFGGLGGVPFMAYAGMREWIRLFSLAMVYLLVMQLKGRISAQRLATLLLLSAALPLTLALLQLSGIPLPSFLQSNVAWTAYESEGSRINSTLGHYNSFATFSLLFMALALWRAQIAKKPLGWWLLSGALLYCIFLSKSITGIVMLVVFLGVYFLPRLRGKGWLGVIALVIGFVALLSSDLAQSRLLELNQTPLLNPDLSISRAMALQAADMDEFRNSFNWRLLQWRHLLLAWREHPWLGYGLASAKEISVYNTTSHNDYIRFLVEGGILGLSLFFAFIAAQWMRIVWLIRHAPARSPQRQLAFALFAFFLSMIVGMAAGNVMVHTATFFYWWALLALTGWQWQLDKSVSLSSLSGPVPSPLPSPSPQMYRPLSSGSTGELGSLAYVEDGFVPIDSLATQDLDSSDLQAYSMSADKGFSRENPQVGTDSFTHRSNWIDMAFARAPNEQVNALNIHSDIDLSLSHRTDIDKVNQAEVSLNDLDVYDPETYRFESDILGKDDFEEDL